LEGKGNPEMAKQKTIMFGVFVGLVVASVLAVCACCLVPIGDQPGSSDRVFEMFRQQAPVGTDKKTVHDLITAQGLIYSDKPISLDEKNLPFGSTKLIENSLHQPDQVASYTEVRFELSEPYIRLFRRFCLVRIFFDKNDKVCGHHFDVESINF
jgi:hypothetical protein